MRGPKSPTIVELRVNERFELEKLNRSTTERAGVVRRARLVLMIADGKSVSETARLVGVNRRIVRYWTKRFNEERLAGLEDKKGRGRKPVSPPGSGSAIG